MKPEVVNQINKLPQDVRDRIADSILAAASYQTPADTAKLIEDLKAELAEKGKVSAAAEKKRKITSILASAKSGKHQGHKNEYDGMQGNLRRAGCPPLEELVFKPVREINEILAKSSFDLDKRWEVKSYFNRLGALD